jgi:signal transduction histidine kinase/CheY-like chemotaxis protein/HAMP domain-containing protein
MMKLENLRIQTKLTIVGLIAILSLTALGFVFNYALKTSKVLEFMITAEKNINNQFRNGTEDYDKYLITFNTVYLDSSVVHFDAANKMAYSFATIDSIFRLPKEQCVDHIYKTFEEAFDFNKDNASLICSRFSLLLSLSNNSFDVAQKGSMNRFLLGKRIRQDVEDIKKGSSSLRMDALEVDLNKMRVSFQVFSKVFSAMNDTANNLLFWSITIFVALLIVLVIVSFVLISRSITIPVNKMVRNFQIIARGNLNTEIPIDSDNEIGQLASSFRKIQDGLRSVIEYTKNVANGDYSQKITPRSNEDELSIALNVMVDKLRDSYNKGEKDSWFKTGINKFNEKLRGEHLLNNLSSNALEFMMGFLHSQLGSIHIYNSENQFLKLESFSGFDPKKLKERIDLNEGILGQVAMKKEMIILSDVPSESFVSFSSSGTYIPKNVVITPLLFNEMLVGVLELSSITQYSEDEIKFIKEAAEVVAININSAINLVKTNELLQKTQEQSRELQVQQEELRVTNEELTEHSKVLTESEKRLQVQQEELRVSNEELEGRTKQLEIQKADIEIKNTELTEIKNALEVKAKELQLSSQYKSEFLANMSHELRTPLNSLLILSNLLANNKKGNLTPDQVQSAQIIHKGGSDLLFLINEVLDLSKIEAGKMTIELAPVYSTQIREEIYSNFNAVANDKNLEFEVSMQTGFPVQIETDRFRLMQIVKNLLSNAFKFTKQGKVSVDFTPTPQTVKLNVAGLTRENSYCIKVTDTGVGIPDEKLGAIFEAFQQADGSISRKYGGTGLGLSISRELIKMLGGEIQLESKLGQGSTFFMYLPIFHSQQPIDKSQTIAAEDKMTNEAVLPELTEKNELPFFIDDDRHEATNGRTVLIIHASKPQAEKFMQQTRTKDYKVVVAATIADGILLSEAFSPKAVMLAVELTKDHQSYQLLKSHPSIKKLPIHIITPVEHVGLNDENNLKTLENFEFADVLKSLDIDIISSSKKILVIEDDSTMRKITKELLLDLDVQIKEASLAEEAFQILSNESFDCLILDLGLPDYSGKTLLEKLRANQIAIPKVIIYTGKEISQIELKSLHAYTNTIIIKGLKSDERLMDEVTLFLHQVSKSIPVHKTKNTPVENDTLFKGKKILVVDDEIRNVFALGKILEDREIEVLDAENGQIAIDVLKANSGIDLILMDVMMPVMDGYEAMRIIRKTPGIQNIPIICLTAKAMKEDHENALSNGANDYLSKPLNEDKLFAMLKIWLYKK